jgi:hypothetical protein
MAERSFETETRVIFRLRRTHPELHGKPASSSARPHQRALAEFRQFPRTSSLKIRKSALIAAKKDLGSEMTGFVPAQEVRF